MAKLKRYRLLNIQSWDQGSDWVELDDSIMNIIIGRNETGKSVLYKVLAQMFIPTQFGNARKDLVRDGFSFGLAVFELDTGVVVIFKVNINNTQEYQIQYPDGRKINAQGDEPPPELAQEFDWFVDTKEGVILNLLHKDTNLPFIGTSKAFNAQLMKFLNEDPRVESIREVFEENTARLKDAMRVTSVKIDKVRYRYDAIEYIDVEEKKRVLEQCFELQKIWGDFLGVLEGSRELAHAAEVPPMKFTAPSVVQLIDAIPTLIEFKKAVRSLSENLELVPEEGDYAALPVLRVLAEYEEPTGQVTEWSKKLLESLGLIPEAGDYEALDELRVLTALEKSNSQLRQQLAQLVRALQELKDDSEYAKRDHQLERLKELSQSWTGNHRVLLSAAAVLQGLLQADKAAVGVKKLDGDIAKMQTEIGVCPTCGRSFK